MINRRNLLKALAATGIGTTVFHRAAVAMATQVGEFDKSALQQAAWVTDMELSDEAAESILASVKDTSKKLAALRKIELTADIAPAIHFQTLPSDSPVTTQVARNAVPVESVSGQLPGSDEEIAFLPVTELSALIRDKKISSRRLTEIYLKRIEKYAPMLRCVVTATTDLAMKQSERADSEIAAGVYRGPLHGIPWGAKDLIDVPGYPTTWGIPYHKQRVVENTATVAERLDAAGAVLVAKTSLGALAMGDVWFEGKTRNPWNPKTGSSGSSAGSASGTVAGLFGFSLGSETLGSITSPAKRCGASGFRPTFGRVSRHGCMPLSWTMDKIGPICRSAEDCALVFDAIHGADGRDMTAKNFDFQWPAEVETKGLKVGYTKGRRGIDKRPDLMLMKELGCELVEVELPKTIPVQTLANIINVEGASVFDQLLRDNETEGWNAWPRIFRSAQFISAIDYLRMMRLRSVLMQEFEKMMSGVDLLCNVFDIFHTNLTGHPSLVIPRDYRDENSNQEGSDGAGPIGKRPLHITLTGQLNDDRTVLAVGRACQQKLDAHLKRPPLDQWLLKYSANEIDEKSMNESGEKK